MTEVCPPEIRFIGGQPNEGTVHMIVIGADTHKGSHALAAVDEGTGRVRGSREIKADEAGHLAAVRWARGLDAERVWAIEDCRHVSRRLEQALLAAGERVVRVAPHRMGASRRGRARAGQVGRDRRAGGRARGRQGRRRAVPGRVPGRAGDGDPAAVRSPQGSRPERTRIQNRLRWHLLELCPELEASLKRGALSTTARSWTGWTGGCGSSSPSVRRAGSRARRSRTSAASPARPISSKRELLELIKRLPARSCWPSRGAGR